jgi:hypothetical protein
MANYPSFSLVPSLAFDGKEYLTFVTHRKQQKKVQLATTWSTTTDKSGNPNNCIDRSKVTVISRIVGPEEFTFRYAVPSGGPCGGYNDIKSQVYNGGHYHYVSFPYGFPVGKLKYTKAWIHNPNPSNPLSNPTNAAAPTFTIQGEFYDAESFEDLDDAKKFHVLTPNNVILFHEMGCGMLYSR